MDPTADEQAAAVLRGLAGAVIGVDLEDRVVVWNERAEQLFGWTANEVLGRPLPILPTAAAEEERRRWITRALAGEELEVTVRRRHRDGHDIDVVLQFSATRDEQGAPTGVAVLCRDATPRLRTASRLQRSQAELALVRRLLAVVQRLVSDLDLSGVLQTVVEAAVDLLGCDAGVLSLRSEPGRYVSSSNVGVPFTLVGHEIERGRGLHGRVLASGEPVVIDDYATWSDSIDEFRNGFRAAVAVPVMQLDGDVLGVLSAHTVDPDRRFGAEDVDVLVVVAEYAAVAIANANRFRHVASERAGFLALVEAIPDGVAVVEEGRVRAWNAAAAALTGHPADEVLGGPPPLDLEAAAGDAGIEVKVGDRVRYLDAARSSLPDDEGDVYLIRDLTEQRDLERAKDLFFATTSHELKTPLTVVRGLAGTLLRHWDRMSDDRRIDALETIERRADNLDRLIERILVGSRVRAGALDVVATPVDLGRLVVEMAEGFAAASGPSHTVVAHVEPGLPLVAGDRQVIDTILGHLLENAIKYSPGGGEVVVSAQAEEGGDRVCLVVRDHGVGIEGDIEPLLHPFVQADSAPTRRFGGVGLGLYIVGQLVHALGGALSAENAEGGGAAFSVAIPTWP